MPEMPEVETICNGMRNFLLGKRILDVLVKRRDLRFQLKPEKLFEDIIINTRINAINRRAKYIIFNLNDEILLVMHLGMSAKLNLKRNLAQKNYQSEQKHTHIVFFCSENLTLEFIDPRRFGFMFLVKKEQLFENKFFSKLGLEPFDPNLNFEYLYNKTSKTRKNIKNLLLDQNIISGIGNIYASEILWHAQINPERIASKISKNECKKIIVSTRYILQNAVNAGGSSIKDFKNLTGNAGYFQHSFKVYNKHNQKCHNENCTAKINRIMISKRASFFCPKCQK